MGRGAGRPPPTRTPHCLLHALLSPVEPTTQRAVVDPRRSTAIERAEPPAAVIAPVVGRWKDSLERDDRVPTAPAARTLETNERAPAGKTNPALVTGGKSAPADQAVCRVHHGGQCKYVA